MKASYRSYMMKTIKRYALKGLIFLIPFSNFGFLAPIQAKTIHELYNVDQYQIYQLKEEESLPVFEEEYHAQENLQQFEEVDGSSQKQEGFDEEEQIDEYTTVYVSQEDANLKRMVISGEPTNFKDENGEYQPIDTTIVEQERYYQNETNLFSTYFYRNIDEGILIEKNGVQVKYRPILSKNGEASHQGNQIIYPFENGTNIRYTVEKGGIKEDIIYNEPNQSNVISYAIEVSNGWIEEGDQVLLFYNHQEEVEFSITAPKAYDASQAETSIDIVYEDGVIQYQIDEQWLSDPSRAYPIIIDPSVQVYAHEGIDVSTSYRYPATTIGNPNVEENNWVLANHQDGYLYVGNQPSFSDSYSFYKVRDEKLASLRGKYIRNAFLDLPIYQASGNGELYACTIDTAYDISTVTYNHMPDIRNAKCVTSWYTQSSESIKLDIREYLKGVIEQAKPNSGLMLFLKQQDTEWLTLTASEYYFIDKPSGRFPGTVIEYYEQPDVASGMGINDFTFKVRPFVKYVYQEAAAYFLGLGIDGVAPMGSRVHMEVKEKEQLFTSMDMEARDNFFRYPNYPSIDDVPNKWTRLESNYQVSSFLQGFEKDKVYEFFFTATKNGQHSQVKKTWFQLYEVQDFDLINHIATFYGVPLESVIEDNNLNDELLTKGNLLFIREPTRNQGKTYHRGNVDQDFKKKIDAALHGRNLQCEYGYEPVNFNTGSFLLESQDIGVTNLNEPYQFERTYDSINANALGSFGYGWSGLGLSYVVETNDEVLVYLMDGKRFYFVKNEDGSYTIENGFDYRLERKQNHYELTIQQEKYVFNDLGYLQMYQDANQFKTEYTYENRAIKSITLPSGRGFTIDYTQGNLIERVSSSDGSYVRYEYDDDLNLVAYIDQLQNQTTYQYDEQHRLISWYNRNNELVVTNDYDEQGRVIHQKDGLEFEVSINYAPSKTVVIDELGKKVTYLYDEYGYTTSVEQGEQVQQKIYENGLLIKEIEPSGMTYSYQYDEDRNLIKKIRENDGFYELWNYDSKHNPIHYENSAGQVKDDTYNQRNQLVVSKDAKQHQTTYTYNEQGLKIQEVDPKGNQTTYTYEDNGDLKQITYSDGSYQRYSYTVNGWLSKTTDQDGNQYVNIHNARGEIIQTTRPNGSSEQFTYDPNGNLIKQVNGQNNHRRMEYNLYGKMVLQTDYLGNQTSYTYDPYQQLTTKQYPNGLEDRYVYDLYGRVVEKIEKGLSTRYTYNRFGVETEENAKGQQKVYTYDLLGRVVETKDYDGLYERNRYDQLSRVIQKEDKYGNIIEYRYDLLDQLIEEESALYRITYQYDENGNQTEKVVTQDGQEKRYEKRYDNRDQVIVEKMPNGGEIHYVYQYGRLVEKQDQLENRYRYEYDAIGNLSKEINPNQHEQIFVYDTENHLIEQIDTLGHHTYYRYDKNYNLIQKIDHNQNPITYTYNSMNQVESETSPLGSRKEYTYDLYGSLIQEIWNGRVIKSYGFDEYQQLIQIQENGLTTNYVLDEYGNITQETSPTGVVTTNVYDEYGRVVERLVDGTMWERYTYDQYNRLLQSEDRFHNQKIQEYFDSGYIKQSQYKGVTTRYTYDIEGNIVQQEDNLGNITQRTFDLKGNILTLSINNQVTSYTYDKLSHQTAVVDALGNKTQTIYDDEGNLIEEIDGKQVHTVYEYDAVNRLIQKRVGNVVVLKNQYDQDGRIVGQIDGLGNPSYQEYDLFNQVIKKIDERGYETSYRYNEQFLLESEIDPLGNQTNYGYDSYQRRTLIVYPNGAKQKWEYDAYGNITRHENPIKAYVKYTYNSLGQLIEEENERGLVTIYRYHPYDLLSQKIVNQQIMLTNTYNEVDLLVKDENALGYTKEYVYDKQGRLIKTIYPDKTSETVEYDAIGQILKHVNQMGLETVYVYDENGQVIQETSGERITRYGYDERGNQIEKIDHRGNRYQYEYDGNDQLIRTINPLGFQTSYVYNKTGQLIKTIDAKNHVEENIVDALGQIVQKKNGRGHLTTYTYDSVGNLTSSQDPKGYRINYEYDLNHNLIKEYTTSTQTIYQYDESSLLLSQKQNNQKAEYFEYDIYGNLSKQYLKSGKSIHYQYDPLQRLIQKDDIEYTYDKMNRLVLMDDASGQLELEYNALGKITKSKQNRHTVTYEYNIHNEKTKVTYPNGKISTYEYDELGNLSSVETEGVRTEYAYDGLNQEVKRVQSNGVEVETRYDEISNIIQKTSKIGQTILADIQYEYDENRSLKHEHRMILGAQEEKTYAYDENDELIKSITIKDGKTSTVSYMYDIQGNPIEVIDGHLEKRFEYNED